MAVIPGTFTFYKAEVVTPWTNGFYSELSPASRKSLVYLAFESSRKGGRKHYIKRRHVLDMAHLDEN